ncbi:hypothetical protein MMC14_001093 [Varicellaria rhodocarpa]|nr:hypothetical protein [Varicellaria rhodocarpa]
MKSTILLGLLPFISSISLAFAAPVASVDAVVVVNGHPVSLQKLAIEKPVTKWVAAPTPHSIATQVLKMEKLPTVTKYTAQPIVVQMVKLEKLVTVTVPTPHPLAFQVVKLEKLVTLYGDDFRQAPVATQDITTSGFLSPAKAALAPRENVAERVDAVQHRRLPPWMLPSSTTSAPSVVPARVHNPHIVRHVNLTRFEKPGNDSVAVKHFSHGPYSAQHSNKSLAIARPSGFRIVVLPKHSPNHANETVSTGRPHSPPPSSPQDKAIVSTGRRYPGLPNPIAYIKVFKNGPIYIKLVRLGKYLKVFVGRQGE